jgi:glycosyltransferase involved in cell wall biosynthesis
MRILSIATTYPRRRNDSEPAFVHALNRMLVHRGHRVTALVPHAPGARHREVYDGVVIKRFVYAVPFSLETVCYNGGIMPNLRADVRTRLLLPLFLMCQFGAICREVLTGSWDVIHCHWLVPQGFMLSLLNPLLRMVTGKRIPVVMTAHGADVYTDHFLFRALNAVTLRLSPHLSANSSSCAQRLHDLYRGVRHVHVIPMGVDTTAFHPDRHSDTVREQLGNGTPQLLFVGRFAEKKGIRYCIDAIPRISKRFPHVRLALVGYGPLQEDIRSRIHAMGHENRIRLIGAVHTAQMPACMASADLLVMPSIQQHGGDTEGLGVVLLEAMASATAVVATRTGGMADIMTHGETGLVCRQQDAEDCAGACIEMLSNTALRRHCTDTALRLVRTHYSWEAVSARFHRLFGDLVE